MSKGKSKQENKNFDSRSSAIFRFEPTGIQKGVINEMISNRIFILEGSSGTTKDTMCLFRGVRAIVDREYEKLVVMKPCEETGKTLGFLKGDLNDKTSPYEEFYKELLKDMVNKSYLERVLSKTEFKVSNYLRGNTFKHSFIIVSEAQNYDLHSLMTIITRVHDSSTIIFNGDSFQTDIGRKSGLQDFITILKRAGVAGYRKLGDEFQMRSEDIVKINKEYEKFLAGLK